MTRARPPLSSVGDRGRIRLAHQPTESGWIQTTHRTEPEGKRRELIDTNLELNRQLRRKPWQYDVIYGRQPIRAGLDDRLAAAAGLHARPRHPQAAGEAGGPEIIWGHLRFSQAGVTFRKLKTEEFMKILTVAELPDDTKMARRWLQQVHAFNREYVDLCAARFWQRTRLMRRWCKHSPSIRQSPSRWCRGRNNRCRTNRPDGLRGYGLGGRAAFTKLESCRANAWLRAKRSQRLAMSR